MGQEDVVESGSKMKWSVLLVVESVGLVLFVLVEVEVGLCR